MQSNLDKLMTRIWQRKLPFFAVFFVVVLATYGFLVIIDFVPEPIDESATTDTGEVVDEVDTANAATEVTVPIEIKPIAVDPLPTKIIIDKLDTEVDVLNPKSRSIADLDAALLDGVVRHPDSADFSDPGNIFILGHSSYLPNVFNKNFQAFNGIQKLEWGDTIRLQSGDTEYEYFVVKVFEAPASQVIVPNTPGEANLTLSTCNSFGSKDDRFIVKAKLVNKKPLN